MADPTLPGIWRVMCINRSITGLGEDHTVNSLAFGNQNPTDFGLLTDLVTALVTFYNQTSTWFRPGDLVTGTMEFRAYHLGDAKPREPRIYEREVPVSGSNGLPEEVAVCLTMYGARNLPRQRGRVYLGPCTSSTVDRAAGRVRVQEGVRTGLAVAASQLLASSIALGLPWVIVSQRDQGFVPVQQGWVDDSFDTQRRRGTAPTTRMPWTATSVG